MKIYFLFFLFVFPFLIFGNLSTGLLAQNLPNINQSENQSQNLTDKKSKFVEENAEEVYGANTTYFFNEKHIFESKSIRNPIDTLANFLYRYDYNSRHNYLYQHLGTFGSPITSIFYELPNKIGQQLGLDRLHYFLHEPKDIKYYDTYSPFTKIEYANGADRRDEIAGEFAYNINANWNVGFEIDRLSSRLMLGDEVISTDRAAILERYLFKVSHTSKKKKYALLFNSNFSNLRLLETGGLNSDDELDPNNRDLFFNINYRTLDNRVENITSRKRKNWLYLYHQYQFKDSTFAIFHRGKLTSERFVYLDEDYNNHPDFYDSLFANSSNVTFSDTVRFRTISNTFGIKGKIKNLFYSLSAKLNNYTYQTTFLDPDSVGLNVDSTFTIENQLFYNAILGYKLNKNSLKIKGDFIDKDQYALDIELKLPFFSIQAKTIKFQPTLQQSIYRSNFFAWDNRDSLRNTTADEINIRSSFKLFKNFTIEPFASYKRIKSLVFWDQTRTISQSEDTIPIEIGQLGINVSFKSKHFKQTFNYRYTYQNRDDIVRQPLYFANYSVAYYNTFKNTIKLDLGFDFHWNSSYFSDSYYPAIQQFNLQNISAVGNYIQSEFFVVLGLKKTSLFFKMTNLLEGLFREGYFATLDHVGQSRAFNIGFRWYFFD